jgi:hypothetical protein
VTSRKDRTRRQTEYKLYKYINLRTETGLVLPFQTRSSSAAARAIAALLIVLLGAIRWASAHELPQSESLDSHGRSGGQKPKSTGAVLVLPRITQNMNRASPVDPVPD